MPGTLEATVASRYDDCVARLICLFDEATFANISHAAYAEGQRALRRLRRSGAETLPRCLARVDVFAPYEDDAALSLPLRWETIGPTGAMVPLVDACLVLKPVALCSHPLVSACMTRLQLLYTHCPSWTRPRPLPDSIVLSRATDAALRFLLTAVAELLAEPPTPRDG